LVEELAYTPVLAKLELNNNLISIKVEFKPLPFLNCKLRSHGPPFLGSNIHYSFNATL